MRTTEMHGIQGADHRGRRRGRWGPSLIAAVFLALVSMALAGPALAAGPPVIEGEGVSHVTLSDATLEATINTEGAEHGVWYQFQLVNSPAEYQTSFACPERRIETGAPVAPCLGAPPIAGSLPISPLERAAGGQAVSLDLTSAGRALSPGTTYHFRVIAANAVPSTDTIQWVPPIVYGADMMFTTATVAGPTVTKVEPNHGSPGGRTMVSITGTGFSAATAVTFGSTSAKSFTVNSPTSVTAVSPRGKGTVDVTVTTPAGTSQTSAADQFTFSKK